MLGDRKPLLGAAIAAGLALYAIAAERRARSVTALARAGNGGLGRGATEPQHITTRGWWNILKRVAADIGRDNISLMAAGVAFYALLSLPPAITTLVALYGLLFDPSQVQTQLAGLEGMIPAEARSVIADQLTAIVRSGSSRLSIGLMVSLAIALWSANSATSAMMQALNVAYVQSERRGVLRYYGSALLLTSASVLFAIASLLLVAGIPAVIGWLPFADTNKELVAWVRWPVLVVIATVGLAVVYRYAPDRREPRWSWVSWGAVAATLLWLVASALFSLYVREFATYNRTYGSLGAVVVLLMWFWLSAFAVLLGAELNAEMERQTVRDTTTRPAKPLGERGAFAADTVAPSG